MPDSNQNSQNENAKIIIELLRENKEDMKHLHECVHELSGEVKEIAVYFEGIEPQVHIIDHAKIKELFTDQKEVGKAKTQAFYSICASLFVALVTTIGTWSVISAQSELKAQIQEVVRAQQSQYPNRK
jgi:predicted nuclease with TOPRIM domain